MFLLATLNYFWQCYPFQGWSLHFSQCCLIKPTCTNLFPPSCFTWRFIILKITHAKEKSYHDQHSIYLFFPFIIEVLKCCVKKQMIFYMIAPMQLGLWKDLMVFHLPLIFHFLLPTSFHDFKKISTFFILSWIEIMGLDISQTSFTFTNSLPISNVNLL